MGGGAGRKTQAPTRGLAPYFRDRRGSNKNHLAGVIFFCSRATMEECLSKQLFGLPASHRKYVVNIEPGLPLFLYNFDERNLYGIFEATSRGQMNINPRAWIYDSSYITTPYPAQVQMRFRQQCLPLVESQFKPVIEENYYNKHHFMFELDHGQTTKLMSLFVPVASGPTKQVPLNTVNRKVERSAVPSHRTIKVSGVEELVSTTWVPKISVNSVNWEGDFPALPSHAAKNKSESFKLPTTLGAEHLNTSLKLGSMTPVPQNTVKRETSSLTPVPQKTVNRDTNSPALSSCRKINEPECLLHCTSEAKHMNSSSLKLSSTSSAPQDRVRWESVFPDFHSRNSVTDPEWFEAVISEAEHLHRANRKLDSRPLIGTYSPFQSQPDGEKAEQEDLHLIITKLKKLGHVVDGGKKVAESLPSSSNQESRESYCHLSAMSPGSMFYQLVIAQLFKEVQELKAFSTAQTEKMGNLEEMLEQAWREIQQLRKACM